MSASPSTVRSQDPEERRASPRTCRCLDYCLVASVVLLSMVVGSLCVLYVALERPRQEERVAASQRSQRDRLESHVHLPMDTVQIKNNEYLRWPKDDVENTVIGSNFKVGREDILVGKSGIYYVYSKIAIKCVDADACTDEKEMSISVLKNSEEDPALKLNIHVNQYSIYRAPSSSSVIMQSLKAGDRIKAQVWTDKTINDWQIDEKNSYLGLFWIGESRTGDRKTDQIIRR